jgi:flagellar biosynthesis protein FlhG
MMAVADKKAHRIAVISGKGGVGKSVITANVAASLSQIGKKVLIIDADLGLANLDVILGISPQTTIYDALYGNCPLDEILMSTDKGFDLIPAGSGVPEGALLTRSMADRMETFLRSLETRYDFILFDAGAGIGDVVLHFANIADKILIVVTPEPTSVMDAYATIKILNQTYHKNEFFLVVNQANPACSDKVGASIVNHLQNVISMYIDAKQQSPVILQLAGSIPTDPAIPYSVMHRQLLAESSPRAPAACQMNNLANFFSARIA